MNSIVMTLLIMACIYWILKRNVEWFNEDLENNYPKSDLERVIEREVHLSQFKQYQNRYKPPTFPDDI